MAALQSLTGLRHESDLASAINADERWSTDTDSGLVRRLLDRLIQARREHPPLVDDQAFLTLPAVEADPAAERRALSVLAQLEAASLVESVGGRTNPQRWRATTHAVLADSAARTRLADAA